MLMLSRLIGGWMLVFAIIAFVYDFTGSSLAGTPFHATTIGEHWLSASSTSFNSFREAVTGNLGTVAWDPVVMSLINVPAWLALMILGLGFAWLGRQRKRLNIFAN